MTTSSPATRPARRPRHGTRPRLEAMEPRTLLSVSLVSVNADGTASGGGASSSPVLSANGRIVAFVSDASDLTTTPDTNGTSDVFVRDLATGMTTLVSVNADGTASGNGRSSIPSLSADGRFVAFASDANDLTSTADTNSRLDVFVRDLATGITVLASINADGIDSGNELSISPSLSADGRFLAFASIASDLTSVPDTNDATDVFVRDLTMGTTTLVSVNADGTASANGSLFSSFGGARLSADGRIAAFRSDATNLTTIPTTNEIADIFVRDLATGMTSLVSVNADGTARGNGSVINGPKLNIDGRFAAFDSDASDLTTTPDTNGTNDVFVRDLATGTTTLVSVNADGSSSGNGLSSGADLSADGRFVAFWSHANDLTMTPDTNGSDDLLDTDVFVRDLATGMTTLVSVNADGTASGNGRSSIPSLSADGRIVAFVSDASDLTTTPDTNGTNDVFVRDLATGTTTLVSVNADGSSSGNGNSGVLQPPVMSADGRIVAFVSDASDLTTTPDTNGTNDVYVAPATLTQQGDPPEVTRLERFGFHRRPTRLVVSFDAAMDPSRAEDLANYRLLAPGRDRRLGTADDRPLALDAATYDEALHAVTLAVGRRLPLHLSYRLTVVGTPPGGVPSASGVPLDGSGTGQPGSDYEATFGREALVRPESEARAARVAELRRLHQGRRAELVQQHRERQAERLALRVDRLAALREARAGSGPGSPTHANP